jgi:hypothetical protein
MIHKCPMCRHQPIIGIKEDDFLCPECGWKSETTRMIIEQTI